MRNYDYIVQEREPEFDRSVLHRKLFPVNMRLFASSAPYRTHILGIISYMEWVMSQTWEDYQSNPDGGTYGISGANLGIPYNIIGFKVKGEGMRYAASGAPVAPFACEVFVSPPAGGGRRHISEMVGGASLRSMVVEPMGARRLRGVGTDPPDCLGKSIDSWWVTLNGRVTGVGAAGLQIRDADVRDFPSQDVVCLCTGSQGEPGLKTFTVKVAGNRAYIVYGDEAKEAATGMPAKLPDGAEDVVNNNRMRRELDAAVAALLAAQGAYA